MPLAPWQAAAIGIVALALGWIVYDLLCRSPLGKNEPLLAVVGFGYVVATSWVFTLVFSGRGALIHTGALMATMMTGNVFFVIMPNQRKAVAALLAGKAPDPKWAKTSKKRSTHNNYITLPVLFMMLSNHYPVTFANPRGHSGDRHLRHRGRRADPLLLQSLARRPRQGAVVGVGGRRASRSGAFVIATTASPGMRGLIGLARLPAAAPQRGRAESAAGGRRRRRSCAA